MKIAVLTFHRALNCGAMLQAWALMTVLERMGHQVSFPDCNSVGVESPWISLYSGKGPLVNIVRHYLGFLWSNFSVPFSGIWTYFHCRRFLEHLPRVNVVPPQFASMFDVLLIGSDQVWSERHTKLDASLFLGECSEGLPIIYYAASFGDKTPQKDELSRISKAANQAMAVSVREQLAAAELGPLVSKPIFLALDPTLLLEPDDYLPLLPSNGPSQPYLFAYVLHPTEQIIRTIRLVASRLRLKPIIAPMCQKSLRKAPLGLTFGISPDRLVAYTRHASCVITTSFHGTAMAVLHQIPFVSIQTTGDDGTGRIGTLLHEIGEPSRLLTDDTPPDEIERLLRRPIGAHAARFLSEARLSSLQWLDEAIRLTGVSSSREEPSSN